MAKIMADVIINSVVRKSGYTTSHVRTMVRRYPTELGLEYLGRRLVVDEGCEDLLLSIVRTRSGKRRKKGERG